MRRRLAQLEMDLSESKEENEQLKQRLSTTLNRINILKTTNLRLITECDKLKHDNITPPTYENRRHDSATSDIGENLDNLQSRLRNTSFDAARQRKLNKTLQSDNDTLTKNLQSLTDKYNKYSSTKKFIFFCIKYRLTHTERDIASKRSLIDNYKTKLTEIETNHIHSNEKSTSQVMDITKH
jgi:chromosome segregation ATPase